MQTTIKSDVGFAGTGLHSGRSAALTIRPAPVDHGIRFRRTDIQLGDCILPARYDLVDRSPLCTRLVNAAGVSVSTIEHLMAALSGCGIHNALIEIDGPEVPILDGSAAPFVQGILARGTKHQGQPVRVIEILDEVSFDSGQGWARLSPATALQMEFEIDFADAAIGRQRRAMSLGNGSFVRELCDSRTFCRQADVDAMRARGLALGGSYDNAVVVDGARVLSPGGLRHPDEAVRHKMLDALGDLALAGAPILGRYTGMRAGHAITNNLLRTLFDTPRAWRMVVSTPSIAARLPGVGVHADEIPAVA